MSAERPAASVPVVGWRDGLDDEIDAEQDYEGLPCAECGEIAYPENYECACPR